MIIKLINDKSFIFDTSFSKYKINLISKDFFLCKTENSDKSTFYNFYNNYYRIYDFLNYGIFRSDTGLVFKNLIAENNIGIIQSLIRKMLKYNQIL